MASASGSAIFWLWLAAVSILSYWVGSFAFVLNGEKPIAAGISGGRDGVTTLLLTAPLGAGDGVR